MLFTVCLALLMSHEVLSWQSSVSLSFSALSRKHATAAAAAAASTEAATTTDTAADKYLLLCTGGLEHVAAELVRSYLGPSEISVEAMQRQVGSALRLVRSSCTLTHSLVFACMHQDSLTSYRMNESFIVATRRIDNISCLAITNNAYCIYNQQKSVASFAEGLAGVGKLLVTVPQHLDSVQLRTALRDEMPWIMLPLALLATDSSISLTSSGLDRVGQIVSDAPLWNDTVSLYARHMHDQGVPDIAEKAQQNSLTFRASIVRDGAHTWKSTDVSTACVC
jgi:hypothetical protein